MSTTLHSLLEDLLAPVYGDDTAGQQARYAAALDEFRHHYGPGPVSLIRAPGRVNLIGEHTDYNGGYVLPAALDKDILLLARRRNDPEIRAANRETDYPPISFLLSPDIVSEPKGHWSNYLRGPAQMAARRNGALPLGLDILVDGAPPFGVPRGAGVSSSSALVVATALALTSAGDTQFATPAFAQACADAEWYVGTRGGIMDHFAAILSRRNHALFLDCRPQSDGGYITRHIPLPADYRLLVVDSGTHHQNARGEFNLRVAACRAGVALLRRVYPDIRQLRDVQHIPWQDLAPHLPDQSTVADLAAAGIDLGELPGVDPHAPLRIAACCRHVWHENHRVLEALDALERHDIPRVGSLLREAHRSAKEDYAISTRELDCIVDTACAVDGVTGARLTGAGWGGCALVLVHADAVTELQQRVHADFSAAIGYTPAMFLCQAGPGASVIATLDV